MAFRTAGRLALREALRAGTMVLLEPVVEVTVTVPDEAVGGVLGDLAARRGRVSGSTARRYDRGHGDRAAGRTVRLRDAVAQSDAGPGHLHDPADRLRRGTGRAVRRLTARWPRPFAFAGGATVSVCPGRLGRV